MLVLYCISVFPRCPLQATVDSARKYAGAAVSQAQRDAQSAIRGLQQQFVTTNARVASTIDSLHQIASMEQAHADVDMARARQLDVTATLRQSAAVIAEHEAQVCSSVQCMCCSLHFAFPHYCTTF
jgi:hypothetical protein